MNEFKTFLKGVLKMLIMVAMVITCIAAFSTGDKFFITMGVVTLIKVGYNITNMIKHNNK